MKTRYFFAALAMLCTLAPCTSQAQSSVRLYGIVDLSMRKASGLNEFTPSDTSATTMVSGADNTSRWGLRIQEDLGGGMRAQAQLESGINAKTGAPANATMYFDRQSWVGLGGRWGLVSMGRQTTLLADAVSPVDPLGMRLASFNPSINVAALSQHQLGVGFGASGSNSGAYRLNNSIKYSGEFAGFNLRLMHSMGGVAAVRKASSSSGIGAGYKAGKLALSAAYQRFRNDDGTLGLRAWVLGAAYTLDNGVRLAGLYGHGRADTSAATRTGLRTAGLGTTVPLGPTVDLTAAYYRVTRERSARPDDGYGRVAMFAEYKLSRRSVLYVEADRTRWLGGFQGAGNKRVGTGISAGMRHSF